MYGFRKTSVSRFYLIAHPLKAKPSSESLGYVWHKAMLGSAQTNGFYCSRKINVEESISIHSIVPSSEAFDGGAGEYKKVKVSKCFVVWQDEQVLDPDM